MRRATAALDRTRRPAQELPDAGRPRQRAVAAWQKDPAAPHPATQWEALGEAAQAVVRGAVGDRVIDTALLRRDEASWRAVDEALGRALWALPWQHEQQRFYE